MNNAFVTSKKDVDLAVVDTEIQRIVREVFDDALTAKRSGDWWFIRHDTFPGFGCSVTIAGKRKLRFRRSSSDVFSGWVQSVLQSNLGILLQGKCSDEGLGKVTWDPKKEHFPTWNSYFNELFGEDPKIAEVLWQNQVAQLPPDLLKLAEKR